MVLCDGALEVLALLARDERDVLQCREMLLGFGEIGEHQIGRASIVPTTPTVAEAGYPALEYDSIAGFFDPRDMSTDRRDRISADIRSIAAEHSVSERLARGCARQHTGRLCRSDQPTTQADMFDCGTRWNQASELTRRIEEQPSAGSGGRRGPDQTNAIASNHPGKAAQFFKRAFGFQEIARYDLDPRHPDVAPRQASS
jgi:hypothetical protein